MSKNKFGAFATESLDELENGIDQAQSTAEDAQATATDAQATAEATATELSQHEQDAAAHGDAAAAAATAAAEGADTTAASPEAAAAAAAAEEGPAESTAAVVEEAVADAEQSDEVTGETDAEVAVMDEAADRTDDVIEAVDELEPENEDAPAEIAATVGMANESLKRLLGPRFNESLLAKLPSNESYALKSVRTRQMYKNLAIESLEESKSGFFERMKQAIVKFWDWLKARFAKLVTWIKSAAKEREQLLAKAKEKNFTNRAVIENATLAQYLTIGKSVEDTPTGLASAFNQLGSVYSDFCERAAAVASIFKGGWSLDLGQFKRIAVSSDSHESFLGGWEMDIKGAGQRAQAKDLTEALAAIDDMSVTLTRSSKPSSDRVTTLNTADIGTVFDAVAKFEKEVLNSEAAKRARGVNSNFLLNIEMRAKSNSASRDEGQRESYRLISRASALLLGPLGKLTSISNQAVSTVNLLAKVSIKAASGESAEEDLKGGSTVDEGAAEQAAAAKATNARPFDPKADRSFSARKAGAEDVAFKDVSNENHSETTVAGGDDPLDLNKDQNPGDADLNQSSQPAAEAPGKQDAKMKETELDLPEEPQVTAALEAYDEYVGNIEDGVDGLDLTERAIGAAEGAQGKQGLDEAGAELMSIASEAIHKKFLGLEAVDLGLGLESFSRSAYKLKATGVSVESWKEKAKEIGTKIIEMIKNLGRMIRYVWKQFLTLFKGLEGKYERISRKLATTNEASMKNGKGFESEKLSINGKGLTPSVFSSAMGAAVNLAEGVVEDSLDLAEIAGFQAEGNAQAAASKVQNYKVGSKLFKSSDVKASQADGATTYTFSDLPGNRVMKFTRPELTDGIVPGFSASIGSGEKSGAGKLRNLDKSESKAVLQSVRKGLDSIKKIGSDIEAVAKSVDEIAKKLDPKKLEGQGQAQAARKAIGGLGRAVMSESKVAIQGIKILADAGLDLVAKSIGMKESESGAKDGKPADTKALPAPAAA